MGFLRRNNHEDEWDIISDEEYAQYEHQTLSPSSNNQPEYISHKNHKEETIPKRKEKNNHIEKKKKDINFLAKDNGYEFEKESLPSLKKAQKWPFILLALVITVSSLGIIGYMNTDFDENGNSYVIPLNLHYKRRYALISDKVLDYINDISGDLEKNIAKLPNDYLTISNKLAEEIENLKTKTDTLSRYTNVPKDLQNYHSSLLNFSLLTQEFLQNLISSYNQSDYDEFAYNGLIDFNGYLREINSLRSQMDNVLFSNMNSASTKDNKIVENESKNDENSKENNTGKSLFPADSDNTIDEDIDKKEDNNEMQDDAFGKQEG